MPSARHTSISRHRRHRRPSGPGGFCPLVCPRGDFVGEMLYRWYRGSRPRAFTPPHSSALTIVSTRRSVLHQMTLIALAPSTLTQHSRRLVVLGGDAAAHTIMFGRRRPTGVGGLFEPEARAGALVVKSGIFMASAPGESRISSNDFHEFTKRSAAKLCSILLRR